MKRFTAVFFAALLALLVAAPSEALQFSTTYRNAMLDQLATVGGTAQKIKVFSGGLPANCGAADTGTLLVEFDLAATSWNAASGGAKALANLPLSANAVGGGGGTAAGYFRIYANDGVTVLMQGTATASGGGGDLTLDNVSIATGQTVNITNFGLTAPGAWLLRRLSPLAANDNELSEHRQAA